MCSRVKTQEVVWSFLSSSHLLHFSSPLCLWHYFSHFLSPSLSPRVSYTRSIPSHWIDSPSTTLPQLLLTSRRKCTTLYNQLNRFAVCHRADLPWGLLVTRLDSLRLSLQPAESEQPAAPLWWHRLSGLHRNLLEHFGSDCVSEILSLNGLIQLSLIEDSKKYFHNEAHGWQLF